MRSAYNDHPRVSKQRELKVAYSIFQLNERMTVLAMTALAGSAATCHRFSINKKAVTSRSASYVLISLIALHSSG
jgi:hypothetical protein